MNIFSGLINSEFQTLFTDAFSALLYNDALTMPCTLSYGVTRYEDCPNCKAAAVGQMPSTRYQDGGPMPFPFGSICPMCNGAGKRPVESTETVRLMIIWDYRKFVNTPGIPEHNGDIQTVTFSYNTPKLTRAKEIIVETDYGRHRFQRASQPQPCGLGNDDFVECIWKRTG